MVEQKSTQKPDQTKPWLKWGAYALGGVGLLSVSCATIGWFTIGYVNLAPLVGPRVSAMLGRQVSIQSLKIAPGRWVRVQLQNVHVANIEGGSAPDMVQVGQLSLEAKLASLFSGPIILRHLQGNGVHVLVERTPANKPNWRFKTAAATSEPAASAPPAQKVPAVLEKTPPKPTPLPAWPVEKGRAQYPTVLDIDISDSSVIYRTAHGTSYDSTLQRVQLQTQDSQSPVSFAVDGAYNKQPIHIEADLKSFDQLRSYTSPYGMVAHITSGDLAIAFNGSGTDPLNVDGLEGAVQVDTPTSAPIGAIAGSKLPQSIPLHIKGQFVHVADLWQFTKGVGAIKGNDLTVALAELNEGAHAQPDHVKADITFDQLNLNSLLVKKERVGHTADADLPLTVSRKPDPLIEAHVAAKSVVYNLYTFQNFNVLASVLPGVISVQDLHIAYLGSMLAVSGELQAVGDANTHIQAKASLTNADIDAYRRVLGFKPVPIQGRVTMQITAEATQPTLNSAISHATIVAAASMTGGTVDSVVMRAASADMGLLFHKAKGTTPINCLLGVVSAQNGVGQVLPLRLKTERGTLSVNARFDLSRHWFDMIFATQESTTGSFALDIPVRVNGNFSDPHVGFAGLSSTGRKMLAQTERLNNLPAEVRQFAQKNACYRAIAP